LTPTSSPNGGLSTQPPTPLGATEVLTSDRFKSALARILGPTSLAKECILEAELAVRELIRRGSPSLRADGALKRAPGVWGSPVLPSNGAPLADDEELVRQASETFRALRAWAMQISGLGAALPAGSAAAPAPLPEHLVALMPPRPAPDPSPHVTFVLALYVERVLTTLGAHLLRLVSGVVARSVPPADAASVADVETALMEDTLVWSWLQGMRVRAFIADEAAQERARRIKGSPTLSQGSALPRRSVSSAGTAAAATKSALAGAAGPARKASLTGAAAGTLMGSRRPSSDSTAATSAAGAPTYARKDSSTGLGISTSSGGLSVPQQPPVGDAFDELLVSGRTLKLSSTPDRLRTYEVRPSSPSSLRLARAGVTNPLHLPPLAEPPGRRSCPFLLVCDPVTSSSTCTRPAASAPVRRGGRGRRHRQRGAAAARAPARVVPRPPQLAAAGRPCRKPPVAPPAAAHPDRRPVAPDERRDACPGVARLDAHDRQPDERRRRAGRQPENEGVQGQGREARFGERACVPFLFLFLLLLVHLLMLLSLGPGTDPPFLSLIQARSTTTSPTSSRTRRRDPAPQQHLLVSTARPPSSTTHRPLVSPPPRRPRARAASAASCRW